MTKINFKDIEETAPEFKSLPEDWYTLEVTEAEVATSSTNKEMIKVTFVVTEGKYKNRNLWSNFTIGGKATTFLYSFLKALNSPLIKDDAEHSVEEIALSIRNSKCSAYVVPSAYNNKETNTILKYKEVTIEGGSDSTSTTSAQSRPPLFN